ncbi:MAG TPA: Arc family DNA-binding protein [Nitrososphaera sp.]|nr:Arc family DNA-binding protein [Nitrososphaera sp.]
MPTLYVENVPKDLYEALRARAKSHRRSMAAEVLALLEENIPTEKEIKTRQALLRQMERMRSRKPLSIGPFPSTEELQREDRLR